jgi:two-component system sensor histidine kinase AlgZ
MARAAWRKVAALLNDPRRLAADSGSDFFLPDFCAARMVLGVVLVSQLLALVFALARTPASEFLTDLARISLFVQWLGLTSAAILCYLRRRLASLSVASSTAAVLALLLANTAVFSELAVLLGKRFAAQGLNSTLFPQDHWLFLMRNGAICVIVTALLLRYFFVSQQWRHHVRAEARSRIHALQARIRPHFLFNSLNTIASLTRSDAARAEEAVEDLADLFRATLKDSETPLTLKEEFELTRIYQRIEMLRLGERLAVKWDIAGLPMRARIPGLTVQPLLENAIYHGIEPLDEGGTVVVSGRVEGTRLAITVSNPLAPDKKPDGARRGNRVALDNIRERLRLAYGDEGELQLNESKRKFEVTIRFPRHE